MAEQSVYRTIMPSAAADYRTVSETGVYKDLAEKGWILPFRQTTDVTLGPEAGEYEIIIESDRLAALSYPYEWSFAALKAAALLHLDVHLYALEKGVTLSDASAYNVQFIGPVPVFIDHLSFKPYREGQYWSGHRQFCDQFLNPLLLRAKRGVPHNNWYRGALEGIPGTELSRILPWTKILSPRLLAHVVLPARFERLAISTDATSVSRSIKNIPFKREAFLRLLKNLRTWISGLNLPRREQTVWSRYTETVGYSSREEDAKQSFVMDFAAETAPGLLWDIGCNTGEYSQLALKAGASRVVGFESDIGALDLAFERALSEKLSFLPLYIDVANPSPAQGWRQLERPGLEQRKPPDAILALAVLHHLCISRNIPIDDAIDFLISLAPSGIIEFVPRNDPKVQQLLSMREDIFASFNVDTFEQSVFSRAKIIKSADITATGRKLVWYDRK